VNHINAYALLMCSLFCQYFNKENQQHCHHFKKTFWMHFTVIGSLVQCACCFDCICCIL